MTGPLNELNVFDLSNRSWTMNADNQPGARFNPGFAAVNDRLFLFGGRTNNLCKSNISNSFLSCGDKILILASYV